jgi:hypothetical protein
MDTVGLMAIRDASVPSVDWRKEITIWSVTSHGLGLITSYTPEEVTYRDGNKGMAWTGIHLTNKVGKLGAPWSSKSPRVVGRMKEYAARELANTLVE